MHTCMRLPQNALCHANFFHHHHCGEPKFRSIGADAASSLFRAACKTLHSWPQWISQLEAAANELLPLYPLAAGKLCSECWDSPPLACNLRDASIGFPRDNRWTMGAALASTKIHEAIIKGREVLKIIMQKICYECLMDCRFGKSLTDT